MAVKKKTYVLLICLETLHTIDEMIVKTFMLPFNLLPRESRAANTQNCLSGRLAHKETSEHSQVCVSKKITEREKEQAIRGG